MLLYVSSSFLSVLCLTQVIILPVARTDGKPLSTFIADWADGGVHEVSLSLSHARALVAGLDLDVLVFADLLSEPMNHYLAHSRLATVQVLGKGVTVSHYTCYAGGCAA